MLSEMKYAIKTAIALRPAPIAVKLTTETKLIVP